MANIQPSPPTTTTTTKRGTELQDELLAHVPPIRRPIIPLDIRSSPFFYDTAVLETKVLDFIQSILSTADDPKLTRHKCLEFKNKLEKDKQTFSL